MESFRILQWLVLIVLVLSPQSDAGGPFRSIFPKVNRHVLNNGDDPGSPLFLTPYIESGDIKTARKLATVGHLDGTDMISYSGFLTVNSTFNSNMFFWFFPTGKSNPESQPVLLWLQGGPGGSSLFGLFVETGPFGVDKKLRLFPHKYAWTNEYNMLYIDNPVGTGFSFTDNEQGYANNEEDVGENLFRALTQFFILFPEYNKSPFYITGESYAGKYIPALGHRIHVDPNSKIQLAGVAIGDGFSDPPVMLPAYSDFMLQTGILDENESAYFTKHLKYIVQLCSQGKYEEAFKQWDLLMGGDTIGVSSYFTNCTGTTDYFNYLRTSSPPEFDYFNKFLAFPNVRRAIHVGNLTYHSGVQVEKHLRADMLKSVKPWLAELMDNYKVLIYTGQLDIIVALPLTEAMLRTVPWHGLDDYLKATRHVWRTEPSTEVSGYVKVVGNFCQVMVRGGGHILPFDQPHRTYDMLHRFIFEEKFF